MSISKTSKVNPSPSAKSARPLRSASESNFTIPEAFITLKFSILSLDLDLSSSIDEV